MNLDTSNIERYSHCLCLHVQPTSLIIGFIHLISSLLNIVLHFEEYTQYQEDERRTIDIHRSTTTSLNMMVSLMMATVSALLIYGVTKSRPSYLMPFFGIQLYIFFFSLPASISMLCFSPHLSNQYDSNSRSLTGDIKRFWSTSDPTTAYTSSIFMALIEFLYQLYFICVIWKCYRYLKMKESIIPLHLPYHLRGVEVTVPSEIVTSPSAMAPPDYETATKLNPPPDYESAIKNHHLAPSPGQINSTSSTTSVSTPGSNLEGAANSLQSDATNGSVNNAVATSHEKENSKPKTDEKLPSNHENQITDGIVTSQNLAQPPIDSPREDQDQDHQQK